jgi:phosphoribosylcarboxyaminoimidazole (NCAIR) mutase
MDTHPDFSLVDRAAQISDSTLSPQMSTHIYSSTSIANTTPQSLKIEARPEATFAEVSVAAAVAGRETCLPEVISTAAATQPVCTPALLAHCGLGDP